MGVSCDPIQKSVPGGSHAQESGLTPVQPERRAGKWHTREWDGVDGAAAQRFAHSRTEVCRKRNPMPCIAEGVMIAIDLACMWQPVKCEIERTAPGVFDAY